MKRFALAPAVAIAAASALTFPLAAEAQSAVPQLAAQERCAALFALVAAEQNHKAPGADRYPPLNERGRDFFVATGLRLMDEAKVPEAEMEPHFRALIARMRAEYAAAPDRNARVDAEMATCLPMLDQVKLAPEAK
ncbi:MAG: hypothetical protein ACKOPG_06455 [Novosphingobium sp.]